MFDLSLDHEVLPDCTLFIEFCWKFFYMLYCICSCCRSLIVLYVMWPLAKEKPQGMLPVDKFDRYSLMLTVLNFLGKLSNRKKENEEKIEGLRTCFGSSDE